MLQVLALATSVGLFPPIMLWSSLVSVGSPVYYRFCFASAPGQNQGV